MCARLKKRQRILPAIALIGKKSFCLLYALQNSTTCIEKIMTDKQTKQASINLAEMLPVGMLAHAGITGLAMAAVANRKYGQTGWEAFHYERISESEFEITGGMLAIVGGAKKWPGPHDSVLITEFEILQEMQLETQQKAQQKTPPNSEPIEPISTMPLANAGVTGTGVYLNLQLALPDDEAGRQRILQAFHLQANFFGAKVLACSLSDRKL